MRDEAKVSKIFQAFLDLRISWRQKLLEGHVEFSIRGKSSGRRNDLVAASIYSIFYSVTSIGD